MDQKIQDLTALIKESELDQTIKDILIRDLQSEGLTDFLKEQIKAYCLEGIRQANVQIERAKAILNESTEDNNPSA